MQENRVLVIQIVKRLFCGREIRLVPKKPKGESWNGQVKLQGDRAFVLREGYLMGHFTEWWNEFPQKAELLEWIKFKMEKYFRKDHTLEDGWIKKP